MINLEAAAAELATAIEPIAGKRLSGNHSWTLAEVASGALPLGAMPLRMRRLEVPGEPPSKAALFDPLEAVQRALAPEYNTGQATSFDLQIGSIHRIGREATKYTVPGEGVLDVGGRAGVGKNALARFLVAQYLAAGWSPVIFPAVGGAYEWAGWGQLVHDQKFAAGAGLGGIEGVARALEAASVVTRRRPLIVLDGFIVDGNGFPRLLEAIKAHNGALLTLTQLGATDSFKLQAGELEPPIVYRDLSFPQVVFHDGLLQLVHDGFGDSASGGGTLRMEARFYDRRVAAGRWTCGNVEVEALAPTVESAKGAGRAVRSMLAMQGVDLGLNAAYNLIARVRGMKNWHQLVAHLEANPHRRSEKLCQSL